MAEVAADEAAARGFRRIALTGTRWLVDSEVYPEKLAARGIECVRPPVAERVEIDRIIMEELVYGVFKPAAVAGFQRIIGRMRDAGCNAVVPRRTAFPRTIDATNSTFPNRESTAQPDK